MSNSAFLKAYAKDVEDSPGIRGLQMNAPIVPSNALADVGLELELEGGGLPPTGALAKIVGPSSKSMWGVHADGSLRGGQEYVLTKPCTTGEVEYMVTELYRVMREYGTRFRLSNRCSTHVHVNVGGKKINQVTSAIALWTTFEEALVNWCGEERQSNHFCLTSLDQGRTIDLWDQKLSGRRPDFSEGMKYTSLNLLPMSTLGSIEFRCMRADEDPLPIVDWARLCHGLVEYASIQYANPQDLASELSERGGRGIFLDVCRRANTSPRFAEAVFNHEMNRDFDLLAMNGFRRAQPIVLGYPWMEWMPLINKQYIPSPFAKAKKEKPRREFWGEAPRMPEGVFDAVEEPRNVVDPAVRPRGIRIGRPIDAAGVGRDAVQGPYNIGLRVDPDRPVCFGNGALGRVIQQVEDRIQVKAVDPLAPNHPGWMLASIHGAYWYDLADGKYHGHQRTDRRVPWIVNKHHYDAMAAERAAREEEDDEE